MFQETTKEDAISYRDWHSEIKDALEWGHDALGDEAALSASVAVVVHGELQHAFHEDCVVPHAGPIHRPRVNIMGVGAHNDIMERLIDGESQIRVTIQ